MRNEAFAEAGREQRFNPAARLIGNQREMKMITKKQSLQLIVATTLGMSLAACTGQLENSFRLAQQEETLVQLLGVPPMRGSLVKQ